MLHTNLHLDNTLVGVAGETYEISAGAISLRILERTEREKNFTWFMSPKISHVACNFLTL